MLPPDFPMVLSPNLGCPKLVDISNKDLSFPMVIAMKTPAGTIPSLQSFKGRFRLEPSHANGEEGTPIALEIETEPVELTDWNKLFPFGDTEDTQYLINSELHYHVLGPGTRYWKVVARADIADSETGLRKQEVDDQSRLLPTLYDLVVQDGEIQRINFHAVQCMPAIDPDNARILHITDAHVAKRNDEMLGEILKGGNVRTAEEIRLSFINFNENFRHVIVKANEMADNGELDFVLLTGDLVDYAFHGWEEENNRDENNYKGFINAATGHGQEAAWGNPGLKVAVFTSTGNHDWRLHPYDPSLGRAGTFGLEEDEAKDYPFRSFNPNNYDDDRAILADQLASGVQQRLNLETLSSVDRWKVRVGQWAGKIHSSDLIQSIFIKWLPGASGAHLLYSIYTGTKRICRPIWTMN